MEVFLIQRRDKYHSGLRFREGYKRRLVESRYLEIQYDIPDRGATGISAVNGGAQRAWEQLRLAVVPASLG